MNIGFYLPKIEFIGGVERLVYLLAKRFNCKIYTSYYREDIEKYFPGISSYIVDISRRKKVKKSYGSLALALDYALFNPREDLIVYCNPRTFYFHPFHNNKKYLVYLSGIPHHLYLDKASYKKYFGKMPFNLLIDRMIWRGIMKFIINPDRVISISKTTAKNLRLVSKKLSSRFIYPPMDLSEFKEGQFEDYYLSVTRFVEYKRVDWQIEAFRDSNQRLIIVGNGPLLKEYQEKIKDCKNIKIVSNLKNDQELIDLYSNCKAFVFTSFYEHFGIVPLEAMASGKPVLSVKEGGPTEYIKEGKNGFYFRNPSELKKLIRSLKLRDLKKMSPACVQTAKSFQENSIYKKFEREFLTLLKLSKISNKLLK